MSGQLPDAALGLAHHGLPVLPLLPRAKRPRLPGGYRVATCDVQTVTEWWRQHPADNIGVRPPPGMVVVDIDPRHGGDAAMRRLTNRHGRLPVTWTARTGGGGWHYWFRVGDIETRARLCEGVDIKHGGSGYVVVPPSRVACRYRWLREPVNEPAVAPDWLREALVAPRYERPAPVPIHGAAQFGLECLLARIAAAPAGSRNKTVFGACRDALRQGNFDAFESALMEAAVARGLTLAEVAAIVRSARRGAL